MAKNEKKKNHRTSSLSRPQGIREVKQSFLIVWEEMCTEPDYFKAFSMTMVNINAVYQGMNIISLVNKAISIHSNDIDAILGWGIAGYTVFIVLVVWFLS